MYRILLIIALIISGLSISYSSEIHYHRLKGKVTDVYGTPLGGVAFQTIFQNHDQQTETDTLSSISIRDTIYYSDKNGIFDLYPLPQGTLHLKVSKLNYLPLDFDLDIKSDFLEATLSLQEDPEAKAKMLEEIEVNATMLKNYADRTELYLTKDNRKFGINALDAISSLPLFRQNINSRKLENMKGENVNILINGRRASIEEIRNLNGENIKKVIYYDNAPARYAGFFGGAVANVILKTPEELTVTGNINAAGSNTYSIQSAVGAALMSPHNYANASFNINYFNQSDRKHESTFDYGDLVNSYSLDEGKERTTTTMTDLSYQWENESHMLFTNFSYSSSTSRSDDRYRISELQNNTNIEGSRLKGAHPISDKFNADIYYSYTFDSGQELSVDILNSFNKNSRHIYDIQTVDSQSAYTDYSIDESTHNDIYTLIANIMFSTPLFGGNLSATLMQNYVNLRQLYSNTYFQDQPSHNDNEQLYSALWASYSRKFNNFGMLLTLMGGNTHIRLNDRSSHNEFRVYPKINLNYSFSNRYTLYFSFWVQSSQNSLGAMNQNRYFIDTRYFAENLPYEKEVMKYSASISGSFMLPVWDMMLFPDISYGYTVKPYLDYIYKENENFIKRSCTAPSLSELPYSLSLRMTPLKGLSLEARFHGMYTSYDMPDTKVRFNWNSIDISASYMLSEFQFMAECASPRKSLDGVSTLHSGWSFSTSALWRKSNFYVSLAYSYSQDTNWSRIEVTGFCSMDKSSFGSMGYRLQLSAGYSFQIGKRYYVRKDRNLKNVATETGYAIE